MEIKREPLGPARTTSEFRARQLQARDMLLTLHDRLLGAIRMPGIVPKLSDTPGEARFVGPGLGEHNQEVYGNLLGLSAGEIASLAGRGVI